MLRYLLLGGIVLSLAACGFRLAGTAKLPPSMQSIHLQATDFSNTQRARLVKSLEQAGARISDVATDDSTLLAVRLRVVPDRNLAISAASGKTVRRLTRELDYRVTTGVGYILVETTTLSQSEDFTLDQDNLLASERELEESIEGLETALFNQMIFRLQRL